MGQGRSCEADTTYRQIITVGDTHIYQTFISRDGIRKRRLVQKNPIVFKGKEYRVRWIEKKYFFISNGKNRVYFFDTANFAKIDDESDDKEKLHEGGGLDALHQLYCSKDVCKDCKVELVGKGRRKKCPKCHKNIKKIGCKSGSKKFMGVDIDMAHPEKYPAELLLRRCRTDAQFTNDLADVIIETEKKLLRPPKGQYSTAALAQAMLLQDPELAPYLKPFSKDNPIHKQVIKYAIKSYRGAFVDIRVKGVVKNPDQWDRNGMYPSKLRNFQDLLHGEWKYVSEPSQDVLSGKNGFGFYRVFMQFDTWYPMKLNHNPTRPRTKATTGYTIYPKTDMYYHNYITAPELHDLQTRGVGVVVIDGYEFHHDQAIQPVFPFAELIDRLNSLKVSLPKDDPLRHMVKECMAALYSKPVQNRHGIGALFNPVYAAYICALARLDIAQVARDCYDEVYSIMTDAVCGKIKRDKRGRPVLKDEPKILGAFSQVKLPDELLLLQAGVSFQRDKEGDWVMFKNRGYRKVSKENITWKEKYIIMKVKRPLHVKEAFRQHKMDQLSKIAYSKKKSGYADGKQVWSKITKRRIMNGMIRGKPWSDIDLLDLGEVGFSKEESEAEAEKLRNSKMKVVEAAAVVQV